MDTQETIKEIKKQFRLFMNGVVSQSMREKGLDYKLNFGIELPRLKEIALKFEKNHDVAQALWKENIRECKILAGLLQPVDTFYPEIADIWVEDMCYPEIAELTCMNLFQHLPYAPQMAFCLISHADAIKQILGYNILSRLFSQDNIPDARGLAEVTDQIRVSLSDENLSVRHAANNCLMKLSSCDKLSDSPYWHSLCEGLE